MVWCFGSEAGNVERYVRVVSWLCAKEGGVGRWIKGEQACVCGTKKGREKKNRRSALSKGLPVARESDTDKTKPSCRDLLDAINRETSRWKAFCACFDLQKKPTQNERPLEKP